MKLNIKQKLLEKISKIHPGYFALASFDFIFGIGIFWNTFVTADPIQFIQGSKIVQ